MARHLLSAGILPAIVFFSFVFVSFFIPPADLFHRLLSFDIRTAGGIVGASVTLMTFFRFRVSAPALLHRHLPLRLPAEHAGG